MVKGPATVRINGNCHVLGKDVSWSTIDVRSGKTLPFEPDPNCILEVNGESWIVTQSARAGTFIWKQTVSDILEICQTSLSKYNKNNYNTRTTVMVTGATDTGKSTFSTYLANMAISRGLFPYIVDGDIGQGDLAPPGALGAVTLREQVIDLRDTRADLFAFVGTITPSGAERLVAQNLRSLVGDAGSSFSSSSHHTSLCIVNTDGYAEASYRQLLARSVLPNVVVCMGYDGNYDNNNNNNLSWFSAPSGPWRLVGVPSSAYALKTHSERVKRRLDQYAKYLGAGLESKAVGTVRFIYRGLPNDWDIVNALHPAGMFVALGSQSKIYGFGRIEYMDHQKVIIRTDIKGFSTIYQSDIFLRSWRV